MKNKIFTSPSKPPLDKKYGKPPYTKKSIIRIPIQVDCDNRCLSCDIGLWCPNRSSKGSAVDYPTTENPKFSLEVGIKVKQNISITRTISIV